ncbi:MAG TPA: MaoC/PaaZ C-terminal domain-containing protein [Blastocatellia bacterium]|nr:MaoC/PaaZ C-terminal domain-containing protein [Blastocatellia bacterium]
MKGKQAQGHRVPGGGVTARNDAGRLMPGHVFKGTRSFTKEEVELFCRVTRDRIPLHRVDDLAQRSKFGGLIVPGLLVTSMFADLLSDWDLLATEITIRFLAPVYVEEPVEMTIAVTEKDGHRLGGTLECLASGVRPVMRGVLKGISMEAVMREH